jgi:hypothetical protein
VRGELKIRVEGVAAILDASLPLAAQVDAQLLKPVYALDQRDRLGKERHRWHISGRIRQSFSGRKE